MNIVMIMSDTLRGDHLGCYGNKNIHTPNLDKFAQEKCLQFNNYYAASFPTVPTRADLFTGKRRSVNGNCHDGRRLERCTEQTCTGLSKRRKMDRPI